MSENKTFDKERISPEITPNIIRQWLDEIGTYGIPGDVGHRWNLTPEYFEALCRYALSAREPNVRAALEAMVKMIEDGWIPPDDADVNSWNRACEEYRQSHTFAQACLALSLYVGCQERKPRKSTSSPS